MNTREHIEAAIRIVGSEAKLGKATGYSQHAIWKAKMKGRVTEEMALRIHWLTKGEVCASRLRPDRWPTKNHVPENPDSKPASRKSRRAA